MSEVQVMRGVLGTESIPHRWVRLKQGKQSVELYVMADGNSYSASLSPTEVKDLADQLYELALRIDAPAQTTRRDERGRFVA